jgi:S1-C subfamily serine protease
MSKPCVALVAFAILVAGCRSDSPPAPEPLSTNGISAPRVERAAVGRLLVMNFERLEAVEASGFFVSADGLLVTCAHVLDGGTPIGSSSRTDDTRRSVRS